MKKILSTLFLIHIITGLFGQVIIEIEQGRLHNEKAELMIADRPGMRSHGLRHPHSWSIIEEVDCILWIKKALGIE